MKKIRNIVAAVSIMLAVGTNVAFAEIPNNAVVIGNKAYSIKYVENKENRLEIVEALKNIGDGKVYIKTINGDWYTNDKLSVEDNMIPEVTYKNHEGNVQVYEAGDGDVAGFNLESVSVTEGEFLKVNFSQEILLEGAEEVIFINDKKVEKSQLELSENGKSVKVKISKEEIEKNMSLNFEVKGEIKTKNGGSITKDISKEFYLVVDSNVNLDEVKNSDIAIIKKNLKIEGLTFEGSIYVGADNVKLNNVRIAKNLILDPGKKSDTKLEEVSAKEMIVLSGDSHTIELKKAKFEKMVVNSNSKTRIKGLVGTEIGVTEVYSSVALHSFKNSFGVVEIKPSNEEEREVSLKGKFAKVDIQGYAKFSTELGTKIDEILVNSDALLEGKFESVVVVGEDIKLEFASKTFIKKLTANDSCEFKAGKHVSIQEVEAPEEVKESIEKIAQVGKKVLESISGGYDQTKVYANDRVEFEKGYLDVSYRKSTDSQGTPITIDFTFNENVDIINLNTMTVLIKDANGNIANLAQLNKDGNVFRFEGKIKEGQFTIIFNLVEKGEKFERAFSIII